jgi:hypothetical protein
MTLPCTFFIHILLIRLVRWLFTIVKRQSIHGLNLVQVFHTKIINKMVELKNESVKSILNSAETNEWFAELYFIYWHLEEDYKCNNFGDAKLINKMIYNTKPAAYQMLLTVIKYQLMKEDARKNTDANYESDVTRGSVMDKYRNIFESINLNKSETQPNGSVMLVATPIPK